MAVLPARPVTLARLAYAVGALVLGGGVAYLLQTQDAGGLVWFFALAPDLPLLYGLAPGLAKGQLHPRAVPAYNATHSPVGPLVLAAVSLASAPWLGSACLAGALAWAAHIGVDRALGFGPRTAEGFQRGRA